MSPRRRRPSRTRRTSSRGRQATRPFLRRRSTLWLAAAVITLTVGIVLGVIADRRDSSDTPAAAPTPTLAVTLPGIEPAASRLQRAEVVDVIDGDTIDVRIDDRSERVRYYGIDAPERGDPCFEEATGRNEALAGDTVLLLSDARERDTYDRLLRYVFDEQSQSIDARLIAEGLAVAWREDGTYRDELVALEEEAHLAGAGCLWAQ